MSVIKGGQVVEAMEQELQKRVGKLKSEGVEPCLAIIRVGEDGSQLAYEKGAVKKMEKNGIVCRIYAYPENIEQKEFEEEFKKVNDDKSVHGILILQPLPKQLSIDSIKTIINPVKDVDAISPVNMYKLLAGDPTGHAPCTAEGVMEILDWMGINCEGKKCAVVGCSMIVGKPLGLLLLAREATVVFCHIKTVDVPKETRDADILICAAGAAKLIKPEYVNKDMTVIDVGINFKDGKMCGDVDFDAVAPLVKNITPVPGGAGAVTTSVLAKHVVKAAEMLK